MFLSRLFVRPAGRSVDNSVPECYDAYLSLGVCPGVENGDAICPDCPFMDAADYEPDSLD